MKKALMILLFFTAFGIAHSAETLLNASYDVSREFYRDINAAFAAHYKATQRRDVTINQSHGGSSAQARAVRDGLDADVVTMNTTTDIDFLAANGLVAADWAARFPGNAAPTRSTMVFLTRRGNPAHFGDRDRRVRDRDRGSHFGRVARVGV